MPCYLDWVSLFGFPRRVICDNHSTFKSHIWKTILDFCDTRQLLPPVYYPRPQGQVEHHMSVLKRFITSSGSQWTSKLCMLAIAHNSSPLTGSQVTPYDLVMGENPRSLVDLLTWDIKIYLHLPKIFIKSCWEA